MGLFDKLLKRKDQEPSASVTQMEPQKKIEEPLKDMDEMDDLIQPPHQKVPDNLVETTAEKEVASQINTNILSKPCPAYQGTEPYAFISYAHADAEKVYAEIKRFNDAGYHVWYDEGIEPVEEFPKEIARANGMLKNEKFMSKAPEAKVQEERDKLARYEKLYAQAEERLPSLAGAKS